MGIKLIKPNTWRIDVHVHGKGRRERTVHGTKAEAQKVEWDIRNKLWSNSLPECSLTENRLRTFGEVLQFYVERKGVGRCKCLFNKMTADLGEVPVESLGDRFDKYLMILKESRAKRTGKLLSPSTSNRYLIYAKTACNYAVKFERIEKNPLARFSRMRETPRDRVLSDIECRKLFNILQTNTRLRHLVPTVKFAFQVPIRIGELIRLKKDSLDLLNNVIRLRNGTTKNRRGTFIPIPPDMVEYFRNLPRETEYLFFRFVDKSQSYASLGDFHKAWATARKLAGIEDFHFHDLRHISATNLVDNGTPERVVREIANWKTDMLNRYYHMSDKRIMQSVRFGPAFDGNNGNPGDLLETPKVKVG
jgi:integrase